MQKINLIYWNSANFGDALSPVLLEELSGLKVQYKLTLTKYEINVLLKGLSRFEFPRHQSLIFPWQKTILCIGSIMRWGQHNSDVWGSGFMNHDDQFNGSKTFAVRGRLTGEKLIKDGFPGCTVYGDPALLLPLWIPPHQQKRYKLGIIPHWTEVDYFIEKYGRQYHIIDLRTRNINKVIDEIIACEHILSTSLHGLIVGHAYNIPSLWIKKGYIDTDGFKFDDYFSSVDIPFYNGFGNLDRILERDEQWLQLFEHHQDKSGINNSLADIQRNLLKSAPFPLKEKYKSLIS